METIGKLSCIRNEREVEWRIEDFSTLSTEDGKWYESPLFYFANASWCLRIYPNGEKRNQSIGYISVCLMKISSGLPISLDFYLLPQTMNEKTDREIHRSHVFEKASTGWGVSQLLKRSEFLESRSELGLPDVLTVMCTMKYLESTDDATSEKLPEDLKAVMLSGDFSDTLFKVKGEEFKLHRAILAARNSYFNTMFTIDMKEKNTGIVSIDDCEPHIFRTFVHFIYTGKVDKLLPENVYELYEVADKYQEDQLKKLCLDFMMKILSEDTFYDLIIFALKYDEKILLEKLVEFFTFKPNILYSVEWQKFVEICPIQANELFLQVMNRHIEKKISKRIDYS